MKQIYLCLSHISTRFPGVTIDNRLALGVRIGISYVREYTHGVFKTDHVLIKESQYGKAARLAYSNQDFSSEDHGEELGPLK